MSFPYAAGNHCWSDMFGEPGLLLILGRCRQLKESGVHSPAQAQVYPPDNTFISGFMDFYALFFQIRLISEVQGPGLWVPSGTATVGGLL